MRVTKKYLANQIDEIMKRLDMPYRVEVIEKTNHSEDDYQGGACYFVVRMKRVDGLAMAIPLRFMIFYPISYLQKVLNDGCELYFKPQRKLGLIQDAEIDYRRIINPTH